MAETAQQPDFSFLMDVPDKDLEEIIASAKAGVEYPGDAMGFDSEALNAVENIALGYYQARQYKKAATVYGFSVAMNTGRATAWRGLGACAHASKNWLAAVICYERALDNDPDDVVSRVFFGECLCLGGRKDDGLEVLKAIIETGTENPEHAPYITRARAIVGADGAVPPKLVLSKKGQKLAIDTAASLAEMGVELDPDRDLSVEDIKKNPELKGMLDELAVALEEGRLTLAEVGGFTDLELDGAYACACKYAEMGQLPQALQIAGYLIMIDSHKSRYYQLVGICMQRLKAYEPAEHFYGIALILDPEDARSLVFNGETKIMRGLTDEGLESIRRGVEVAGSDAELKDVSERGEILLKRFKE